MGHGSLHSDPWPIWPIQNVWPIRPMTHWPIVSSASAEVCACSNWYSSSRCTQYTLQLVWSTYIHSRTCYVYPYTRSCVGFKKWMRKNAPVSVVVYFVHAVGSPSNDNRWKLIILVPYKKTSPTHWQSIIRRVYTTYCVRCQICCT